ncbi:hypothetical protein A2U01_0072484, partial [Trifolium medium]|nr:hypothetical protein [Trifolium medium]
MLDFVLEKALGARILTQDARNSSLDAKIYSGMRGKWRLGREAVTDDAT